MLVVGSDVVLYGLDQVSNAPECAAAGWLRVISANQCSNLVEPGGTGRREVHMVTRSRCEPLLYVWMLVGSVVVEGQMNSQFRID